MTGLAPLTELVQALCWPIARQRTRDQRLIPPIRDAARALRESADKELLDRAGALRTAVGRGVPPQSEEILVPGFALVCEAARRTLGIQYYDVQLLAGIVLARGSIAEMATGEGKTFVAALPAFLHGLTGRGVHVVTVNSYLAERDYGLLAPLFQCLGISVGLIRPQDGPPERTQAYACEVTYGPGYEFGFDYLRDQIALLHVQKPRLGDSIRAALLNQPHASPTLMQRGHCFAIIDEADSVMIDEATMPLVLSGTPGSAPCADVYHEARFVAGQMVIDRDYVVDESAKTVRLTKQGEHFVTVQARHSKPAALERPWLVYVEQALHAQCLLHRDSDYVVADGRALLVDEFTGRIFADRSLREGLHQAVEAKEGLSITSETQPLARISRQRFFSRYSMLCGMTGTATGSEREFQSVYRLSVERIPTRLPCRRVSQPDRYFSSQSAKWHAIMAELDRLHRTGRPVLVGTRTIEASELLAEMLSKRALPFQLLNGRQDQTEAEVVARAGEAGAITIATNMAGRGTDIKLSPGVAERGGLHIIGTERHESRRIDFQLAGRAARQGDPGSYQFFVSANDGLIRCHAPWLSETMRNRGGDNGELVEDLSRSIKAIQRAAERQAQDRRRQLFARDSWIDEVLSRLASEG